ncbi:hypothetical protein [Klebsiella quasipneumoniae]|uniref:hypothetical protein n=1 Tax=Klebsiella quasipneumoniae TaxID=1463165 RepID=UPI0015DCAFFD|nr:hypothetical protein [Klebsiella quasipneumoniae]BBQ67207.1 hypothetical protein WP3W18C02_20260 [Klebsiella quasipneumoniae]BBQ68031.1 hypothetical protein WP3W18C02_28500 [Klebsiella quasipneumoniae]BBR14697.1 hypothetical protein WP3S18E03_19550 [Klebsiella quasipneumoniae]BBR15509.1 hypothetical protein WP3S18E03_27670 [Klebsiella quasipneumoniae]
MNNDGLTLNQLAERNAVLVTEVEKLRAERDQLAAQNVALKAGVTYFAYSPEYGFDYFKDKQSAIDTAQAEIDAYREGADDGWSEDVQRVSWGIVIQQAQGFDAQGLHTSDSQHTYQTCNYRLVDSVETPATDAYLAGIKADGVEMFALMFAEEAIKDNNITTGWKARASRAASEYAELLREGAK